MVFCRSDSKTCPTARALLDFFAEEFAARRRLVGGAAL
jgi:hypothetical protein